jgi:cytoskeletal protein CcmA (bactofilin family)
MSSGGTAVPLLGCVITTSLSQENGMFGKGKSAGEGWKAQPPQRSALARSTAALQQSQTISSLSSAIRVVGKIGCKGVLKIYGLVEGEVIASNALIADGARIQGDIVAEELTVAGRIEGDIYALRVKLQGTAVVEGDIFHRSLSVGRACAVRRMLTARGQSSRATVLY